MYSEARRLSRLRRDYFLEGDIAHLILEMRPREVGDWPKVSQLLKMPVDRFSQVLLTWCLRAHLPDQDLWAGL